MPNATRFALTLFHPKPPWLALPHVEATRWLTHRIDQVREHMLAESGSGIVWVSTFPLVSETLPRPIALLWSLADRDAVQGLLDQLNRVDVQQYFEVAVTTGVAQPALDEIIECFTHDLDH